MIINFTDDCENSFMKINPLQGLFILEILSLIPMDDVMFIAMQDPNRDHQYYKNLCRFYCDLKKSLQDFTDEQYILLQMEGESHSPK